MKRAGRTTRRWHPAVADAGVVLALVATAAAGCGNASSQRERAAAAPLPPVATGSPAPAPTVTAPAAPPVIPSLVATATAPLTVFHKISAPPYERLSRKTKFGSPRVLLVTGVRAGWVRALLPERPNGAQGWVPASQVSLAPTSYRVEVSRRRHTIAVFRDGRPLLRAAVVTGAPGTPTPAGIFYVTDVLPVGADQPAYGPWALALSGYSPTLTTFAGSDAEVALHGTNEPWLLGRSASHGCIRMGNAVITRLAHLLPLGTPVVVS